MLLQLSNNLRLWLVIATAAAFCGSTRESAAENSLRIATYNASLYGKTAGEIRNRLADGKDVQAEKVAAIVQTIRPDVLLVNEIDYEPDGATAKLLAERFFAAPQGQREPMEYPHVYFAPSNTGVDSGIDLNDDGKVGRPNDAWGYGVYCGHYSMAIYSRYPIKWESIRTFQQFLWNDLPGALRPIDPDSKQPYYDDATWNVLRLSSKNHVDVPIEIGGRTLHVLASHPTPPVFDGKEDRNGCRNHDEIRFWIDYLKGPESTHLIDDQSRRGGLDRDASFVIVGDLNSDPSSGDSRQAAIRSLLADDRLIDPKPSRQGGASDDGPHFATARFGRNQMMRVDYVLPSRTLPLTAAGIFWPQPADKGHDLISASDHRMVWVEVTLR